MRLSYRRSAEEDQAIEVDIVPLAGQPDVYTVTIGERMFTLSANLFHRAAFLKDAGEIILQYDGKEYHLFDATQRRRSAPGHGGDLHAPMAGKIIRVLVQPDDAVKAGDTLVILEAMKMEQQIVAPRDGVVTRVLCREGEQVTAGMELVVLTEPETSAITNPGEASETAG